MGFFDFLFGSKNAVSSQSSGAPYFLENFRWDNWSNLTEQDRFSNLQKLENYMASQQGRSARQVMITNEDCCGYYSEKQPDFLNINENYLYSQTPGSNYDAMDTIIHEGRHAYQDDAINGRLSADAIQPDADTLQSWEENFAPGVYNRSDVTVLSEADYRFQPIEADANDYALDQMKGFQEYCGDDPSFDEYLTARETQDEYLASIAEKYYGEDYKEEIADGIHEKYENYYGTDEDEENSKLKENVEVTEEDVGIEESGTPPSVEAETEIEETEITEEVETEEAENVEEMTVTEETKTTEETVKTEETENTEETVKTEETENTEENVKTEETEDTEESVKTEETNDEKLDNNEKTADEEQKSVTEDAPETENLDNNEDYYNGYGY